MTKVLVDMYRLKRDPFHGLYTFSYHLGKSLAGASAQDIELYFYLPKKDFGIFGEDHQYVQHRSIDKFYRFGTNNFDVWHNTTTISHYRPFNARTKVIFTIHDLNFIFDGSSNAARIKRLLKEIQEKIDRADYIVGISQFALDFTAQNLKTDHKKQMVIHNGCNKLTVDEKFKPIYKPEKPFLFSIGSILPRKNFHVLPGLLVSNDYELLIAGMGGYGYEEKIMEEARKAGVEDRVKFTGPVGEKEKAWYYNNCEAFVFPSLAEGFGLPVLEAMQFGKPVFLSRSTSLPEIGGEAAYYFNSFEPADMQDVFQKGMQHFIDNNGAELSKKQAALFSWDTAAEQYLNLYRELR